MNKKRKASFLGVVFAALTTLIAGSACNLTLRSAFSGTPQVIVITTTGRTGGAETPDQAAPSDESAPALSPTFTLTLTITSTATPIAPTMTAGQELSCVKGPHWILYEWVAKINEGETVTLLAKASEDWEEYYWVHKNNGTECWAFGGSSTKTGDYLNLPIREAPPLPEITYTIKNATGLDVIDVRIREEDSAAWGPNLITPPLAPGATFSKTLTAGFYDVRVLDLAGGALYEKHDWPIGSEAFYRDIVLDEELEFFFENGKSFDLCKFSLRLFGGSWFDVHTAADGHVTPGNRITFSLLPALYDIEVRKCTGGPPVYAGGSRYFGPANLGYVII